MHPLARLAQEAVVKYVLENKIIDPPACLDEDYCQKKSGVFVSIKQNGQLRGCIGTYLPTKESIAQEVIANAIEAAAEDPRFDPITKKDLPNLSYEVYVLEKLKPVKSLDELDPKIFGVIVAGVKTRRQALLLPGLEGIDTIEQQISCVCQKAGIDPSQEKISIFRFMARKFQ